MGVAGCGKSAIGAALATRLGATYVDGGDRWPWLTVVGRRLAAPDGVLIIGCSALKRHYRDHIAPTPPTLSSSCISPAPRT
ncbi:hypothetical protein C770_GR4pA049 (plasmid) [Sinorhizobium meliloti GR4]|nr:hypothetical protein C770_GR4pA049 [Sinorhizobium meliloti GR4]